MNAIWKMLDPLRNKVFYNTYYAKTFGKNVIQLYIATQGGRIIWKILEFSPLNFD